MQLGTLVVHVIFTYGKHQTVQIHGIIKLSHKVKWGEVAWVCKASQFALSHPSKMICAVFGCVALHKLHGIVN